jgi:predicted nucleic acid-binding protein
VIVLDASVLIAHLDASNVHHEESVALLRGAAGQELAASVITVAQVMVGPARARRAQVLDEALTALGVKRVALLADDAAPLATLRATTGLRMPDCCVLLTARSAGATLATVDHRLAETARGLGVVVVP